jgi:hypothetical protein
MLERFKAKDFDGGLIAALEKIDQTMGANAKGASRSDAAAGTNAPVAGTDVKRTQPRGGACGGIGTLVIVVIVGFVLFRLVRGMLSRRQTGGGMGGIPTRPGYDPRTGQPIDPRYGPVGNPQQGGGFGRGMLGGLLGGVAGGYLYDKMRGPGGNEAHAAPPDSSMTPLDDPGTTSGFADFGSDAGGGGDFGGGGGGDSGGGGDF